MDVALHNHLDDKASKKKLERHEALLDIWWTKLVPRIAGNRHWGPSKRNYELLSSGKETPGDEKSCYVTASDEAFLVVLWLNCYRKWMYEIEVKRLPRPGRPAAWKEGDDEPENEMDAKDPRFQTPYTSSNVVSPNMEASMKQVLLSIRTS